MASDSELFRAWQAGDRQAGSQLFARHFDSVYRFFRNKLDGDVGGRERFRAESSFRTYLFAVAHNVLCDHLRRRRRAGEVLEIDESSAVDLGASPSSVMVARSEEKLLLQALRRIPLSAHGIRRQLALA